MSWKKESALGVRKKFAQWVHRASRDVKLNMAHDSLAQKIKLRFLGSKRPLGLLRAGAG